jgi:beta-glucosidase
VLYPFGFGLSYARFSYGAVRLLRKTVPAGETLTATVTLRNMSSVAGTEVAELYVAPPQVAGAPRLALAGVQRVHLNAGEVRQLKFMLEPKQMSFVDRQGKRAVRQGTYRLFVGGGQPRLDVEKGALFQIAGEKALEF